MTTTPERRMSAGKHTGDETARALRLVSAYRAMVDYDREIIAKERANVDTMLAAFDEVAADRDRIEAQRDALLSALEECVTKLVVTENNIHRELSHRGIDRWEGVPEVLAATIAAARQALSLARGES